MKKILSILLMCFCFSATTQFTYATNYNLRTTVHHISESDDLDPCQYNFGQRSLVDAVCIDPIAENYFALLDSISPSTEWATSYFNPDADNFQSTWANQFYIDNTICDYIEGCTDVTMFGYNPNATLDDGSCIPYVYGCMEIEYVEYNENVNTSDNSCSTIKVFGCNNVNSFNYDPDANTDDGSCVSSQDEITADLFVAPLNTGSNMTVMISSTSFDSFSGSLIGAFKDIDSDGVMNCVAMYTIQEGNFGFPIWGDDTSTDEIDGIQDGDKVTFAILTEGEVKIISPYPLFNGFQANAIHIVNEYYTPISYSIEPGWNMVGYVGSSENNGIVEQMNSALNNDANIEETFQVIKNVSGQFWSSAFAQINTFTQGEGYMMYLTSEATSLNFQNPSSYQYGIEYPLSSGWNMVSFTGDVDADNSIVSSMDVALENEGTTEETFQVIKNVSGQFWSSAFAQINSFIPGEAYMMYVIGQATTVNFQRE